MEGASVLTANYDDTEFMPTVNVRIIEDLNKAKDRPEEHRTAHRTIVLTAANPYAQLAGYDPARIGIWLNVMDNPIVLSGSISEASDIVNTVVTINQPGALNQIPLGASGVAAYNNNPYSVIVAVQGGTVTAIAVNGTNTGQTSGNIQVPAYGTIAVTYTVPPTTFFSAQQPLPPYVASPNGRVMPIASDYVVRGQDEHWITGFIFPSRVSFTIVRKI